MKQIVRLNESELHQFISECVKQIMNEDGITTYQNPTETWQAQNNYIADLNNQLQQAQASGNTQLVAQLQQKISMATNAQRNKMNESELKGIIKEAVDNLMAESAINEGLFNWLFKSRGEKRREERRAEEDKWLQDYNARKQAEQEEKAKYHNQRMTQQVQDTRAREQAYKKNAPQWVRDIWDGYYGNLNGISTSDVRAAQRQGLLSQDQAMEAQRVINNMLNKRAGL